MPDVQVNVVEVDQSLSEINDQNDQYICEATFFFPWVDASITVESQMKRTDTTLGQVNARTNDMMWSTQLEVEYVCRCKSASVSRQSLLGLCSSTCVSSTTTYLKIIPTEDRSGVDQLASRSRIWFLTSRERQIQFRPTESRSRCLTAWKKLECAWCVITPFWGRMTRWIK